MLPECRWMRQTPRNHIGEEKDQNLGKQWYPHSNAFNKKRDEYDNCKQDIRAGKLRVDWLKWNE